ncbi:MAG: cadmium-translocating P-type ATPase [Clostridia bacterium]|nr:cadmium-translocating P-type ATPase [Clostridia bacterium]
MDKKTFDIIDLDCAACSVKIEKAINGFDDIDECVLDFIGKKLYVTPAREFESDAALIEWLEDIVHIFESEVHLVLADEETKQEKKKTNFFKSQAFEWTKIGVGFVTIVLLLTLNLNFWIQLGVGLAVYLLVSYDVIIKTFKKITKGNFLDENFLMTVATIGALALQEFSEALGVMVLYKIGEIFQDYALQKSRKNIIDLINLKAEHATLLRDGEEHTCKPEKLQVGDIILIKKGERVPVNCAVIGGSTYVNTVALTGETKLKTVYPDDVLLGGYIVDGAPVRARVIAEYKNSAVARILDLVEHATSKKARAEKFISKFARVYTPVVMGLALVTAFIPPIFVGNISTWIYRALSFLVISCPCAIVISVPLTYFGGIGISAKNGLLIKGASTLETLASVDTVVVDKTGTLTKGVFEVQEVYNTDSCTRDNLIKFMCYAESGSNHPIAKSVMKLYSGKIFQSKIFEYDEVIGLGIMAVIEGKQVLCGNEKLLKKNNIKFKACDKPGVVVYLAINGEYAGYVLISDALKENVKYDIETIKSVGVKHIVMLTGDTDDIASSVSKDLGINEYYANLLPENKVEILQNILKDGKGKVAYVGDGINDAPVLMLSDVGIAMGKFGQDVAIEAGDVVLLNDTLSSITSAIKIAKRTRLVSVVNVVFALGVKVAIMIMGVCGISSLWWAVIGDVGVSIVAILNAMTMLLYKPNKQQIQKDTSK